ncbi:acyltransferase family protein [Rhodococcus sp. MEB064]|uniref:acyltransferase family protein n=1 Tax=Rhodococcus sp. MEB064 TaxID=1587522 RepID=UPI0005AD0884|nr:acyltransferase family protein [Rhodococcus sp. MEB064]KIQ11748.1 acyltransferase [Rhodococcus sp. MEB064]
MQMNSVGGRRPDLQGMRALAVLAVFADHLFGWPSGGFVGVDVFFVLSGFFITGLLIRECSTTGKLSFEHFYVRRAKRILPSAMLVLVLTAVASFILFPAVRAKETLLDALYAAVFAANIHFEAVGTDYFQEGRPPSPLQHYWSLSIEEQFYFVWPVMLVLIFALTRRLERRGKARARQSGLFTFMLAVVSVSFAWSMHQSAVDPNAAYFSTFTRVWELGVGALIAIAGPWLLRIPSAVRPALAYLGLAGVTASLFLIDSTAQFPAPWAALPVVSTAIVIASFHGARVRGMALLTNPLIRYFGDTSYTLYLWHWPVIILLLTVIPKGPVFYGSALIIAVGLTAVTYRFYEDPIRKSTWLQRGQQAKDDRGLGTSPTAWGVVGVIAAAVIVASIAVIQLDEGASGESQAGQRLVVESTAPSDEADPCFGAPAMVTTSGCAMRDSDITLQPGVDRFADDTQGAYECFRREGAGVKSCTYGYEGDDAIRIALVGDSHAAMLLPALAPYLVSEKWRLTSFVGWGCQWQDQSKGDCAVPMKEVQSQLLTEQYDLVLTTSSRKYGGQLGVAAESYERAWTPVAAAGSRIAVIADNPAVSPESLECLTRVSLGRDTVAECGTPTREALSRPDPLIAAAARVPSVSLIDLTEYYCTTDLCPSVIGNVIVYRDAESHLTATFAKTLAPTLVTEVKQVLTPS